MSEVWGIDEKDRRVGGLVIATPTGNGGRSPVAMVFTKRGFGNFELAKRRAKLVSAAPELLEALQLYMDAVRNTKDKPTLMSAIKTADDKARAAIKKATE